MRGEVLADDRHAEVGAVLAAVLLRERVAVVAGGVGAAPRLAQQRLPLLVRQAAALPVGARVLAAVVEEADVVVLLLERLDLALDELVELVEVVGEILRDVEVHGVPFQSGCVIVRLGSVSRSSRFSTLPAALRGSSSLVIQIRVGTLNEARRSRTWVRMSSSVRPAPSRDAHHCADLLAEALVGDADDRGLGDVGVLVQRGLDLGRVDVLSAADDDVLQPIDDVEVALVVEPAEVTGRGTIRP